MRKSSIAAALGHATMVAFVAGTFAAPAMSADYQGPGYFGWLSVGTTYPLEDGHLLWLGQFSGINGNSGADAILENASVQCPGYLDIDAKTGTAKGAGYCVYITPAGDKAFSTWHCEGGAPMSGKPCAGGAEFSGGTGKLEGLSGTSRFDGNTVAFHPDGTGSGYTTITFDLTLP